MVMTNVKEGHSMFRTIVLIALFLKWLTDIPPGEDTRQPTSVDVVTVTDHVSDATVVNNITLFDELVDSVESRSGNYD